MKPMRKYMAYRGFEYGGGPLPLTVKLYCGCDETSGRFVIGNAAVPDRRQTAGCFAVPGYNDLCPDCGFYGMYLLPNQEGVEGLREMCE